MHDAFDAFWRAIAGALHPAVLLLALLPMALAGAAVFAAGWFFWEDAVAAVRASLQDWELLDAMSGWLDATGGAAFHAVLAPLIVVALALPVVVIACLLLVTALLAQTLVVRVAQRRYPALERRGDPAFRWQRLAWSAGLATLALAGLVLTLPLWLVPPLGLGVPALVWGWLAARVLTSAGLAVHAEPCERRALLQRYRWPLRAMGVCTGVAGSVPTLLWLFAGATSLVFAPLLMVLCAWVYTMVFVVATLWFIHFTLAGLQSLRSGTVSSIGTAAADEGRVLQPQNSGIAP